MVDVFEKAFIPKNYISNSNERLKAYGALEEKSKLGLYNEVTSSLTDRFGPLPEEVYNLIGVMKIKKTGSLFGVDKIIIKRNKMKFVYFNNTNKTNQNQERFVYILNYLNELHYKTTVTEKKDQIIINVLAAFSINKTLSFLKKIKKQAQ